MERRHTFTLAPKGPRRAHASKEQVLAAYSVLARHGPRKRRPPRLSAPKLLAGLVYHVSQKGGSFGAHLTELTGEPISETVTSGLAASNFHT